MGLHEQGFRIAHVLLQHLNHGRVVFRSLLVVLELLLLLLELLLLLLVLAALLAPRPLHAPLDAVVNQTPTDRQAVRAQAIRIMQLPLVLRVEEHGRAWLSGWRRISCSCRLERVLWLDDLQVLSAPLSRAARFARVLLLAVSPIALVRDLGLSEDGLAIASRALAWTAGLAHAPFTGRSVVLPLQSPRNHGYSTTVRPVHAPFGGPLLRGSVAKT